MCDKQFENLKSLKIFRSAFFFGEKICAFLPHYSCILSQNSNALSGIKYIIFLRQNFRVSVRLLHIPSYFYSSVLMMLSIINTKMLTFIAVL